MSVVFIDTVALIALVNRDDGLHAVVEKTYNDLMLGGSRFVTSDWVFCEFLGGAARLPLRRAAIRAVNRLRDSQLTEVVPASHRGWTEAFELYQARPDKDWSLVDCSSILICQSRSINDVLTADHHFVQAGLNVLIS